METAFFGPVRRGQADRTPFSACEVENLGLGEFGLGSFEGGEKVAAECEEKV